MSVLRKCLRLTEEMTNGNPIETANIAIKAITELLDGKTVEDLMSSQKTASALINAAKAALTSINDMIGTEEEPEEPKRIEVKDDEFKDDDFEETDYEEEVDEAEVKHRTKIKAPDDESDLDGLTKKAEGFKKDDCRRFKRACRRKFGKGRYKDDVEEYTDDFEETDFDEAEVKHQTNIKAPDDESDFDGLFEDDEDDFEEFEETDDFEEVEDDEYEDDDFEKDVEDLEDGVALSDELDDYDDGEEFSTALDSVKLDTDDEGRVVADVDDEDTELLIRFNKDGEKEKEHDVEFDDTEEETFEDYHDKKKAIAKRIKRLHDKKAGKLQEARLRHFRRCHEEDVMPQIVDDIDDILGLKSKKKTKKK